MRTKAESRPAFFCSGDTFAGEMINCFSKNGYRLPDDYGLMGYDCVSFYQNFSPKLTTVDNHVEQMGYEAANMLIDMIAVSYTHLDVYKRQIPGWSVIHGWQDHGFMRKNTIPPTG